MAHSLPVAQPRISPRRRPLMLRLLDLMSLRRQRRALTEMEPHLLADIGLSAAEADAEARRPIWDAPAHWRL
ncbi:DUF1127 domain-containing protein [Gemmobacter fulvus]|uniref:DUF1127 domain-containing protein n=1 Tax=Gemmobacter fulvus TaxID=2840474 RepID=A0A975P8F1_9RHOB|nr:DUF1127 domain-containing protein [Gemmobacter fulvus]MBT9244400.1 DUF1127 domain-containing protein [Gemmobacter fulvus]QWK91277.1 DUF1127 domain-containing protein [Gemmobacter fulvus]